MSTQENSFGFVDPASKKRRTARVGVHPLHEAAMRLADLGFTRPRSKTKDLVGLLLCHGARAWRSSQSRVVIHVKAGTPVGRAAVKIRFQ
jgi:hypothetical protein